ncbi:hypothetical protein AAGW05_12680 [Arthrobacter sp. LAPM80]|uniref:hypothetical protein n=1 Tax=Arthrobacter sp. LAPM80 TaxID=3141788 RepID=UPI00398B7916
MASWRDTTSEAAQEDLGALLNIAMPFAEQCLEKYGEFFPFAAAIGTDGEPIYLMAEPDEDDAIVVSDVSLSNQHTDAVHFAAEHADGIALSILQPYTLGDGGPEWGEMTVSMGEPILWRATEQ